MTINELKNKAKDYPIFKLEDVFKWFPKAKRTTTLNQLAHWSKLGYLEPIKRGIYKLSDFEIKDPFILANFIYSPSCISLETALNYYSLIPDIPFQITSVCIAKTARFKTKNYGVFSYSHIKTELFFGYETILAENNYSYNIAFPEKALFDYIYFNYKNISSLEGFIKELRLDIPKDFKWSLIKNWAKSLNVDKKFVLVIQEIIKEYGQ